MEKLEVNYRYNSKNEDIKRDAIEYILAKEYGTLIQYEEIAQIIKLNINVAEIGMEKVDENLQYLKQFVGKLKNILIRKGYVLKSVKGCGWYILKPNQISSYTYRNYIVKPQKAYRKANEILDYFDKSKLSEDRLEEYKDIDKLNKTLQEYTDNIIFSSKYIKNKNYYNNLED